jgi:hypothetical protein
MAQLLPIRDVGYCVEKGFDEMVKERRGLKVLFIQSLDVREIKN